MSRSGRSAPRMEEDQTSGCAAYLWRTTSLASAEEDSGRRLSTARLSRGLLVAAAARRVPVTVQGRQAVLVGAPRGRGNRIRVEFETGHRRSVSKADVELLAPASAGQSGVGPDSGAIPSWPAAPSASDETRGPARTVRNLAPSDLVAIEDMAGAAS